MPGVQRFHGLAADRVPAAAVVRHRVVVRVYHGDVRRHAYLAVDLAHEGYFQVHPLCSQGFGYRLAHVVGMGMIGTITYRDLGNRFEACEACTNWLRNQPHEVLVGTEVVAVRGTLDLSEASPHQDPGSSAPIVRAALAA